MPSELIQTGNKLAARTPGAFEEAMRPVADICVQEVLGRQFSADVQLFKLPRTAFFRLKLPRARVVIPDGSGFVAVNIVSRGQVRTASPKRGHEWEAGTAHVVNHEQCRYDFTSDENLDAKALCFRKPLLREYARKFFGIDDFSMETFSADANLDSNAGGCFLRFASFVWEELDRGGAFLKSPLATKEIEESLWALLLSTIESDPSHSGHQQSGGYATYVKPAEEYIAGHLDQLIRVADIAEAVGVSVPTLNRAFRKCHGVGPKAFVKRRRLERVRSELQAADSQTSVSEIASKYAFWHFGQFAADYKKAFHESPSETRRRS